MRASFSLLSFAPLAIALPAALSPYAGGPTAKPIPSNCTLASIAPSANTSTFALTPSFQSTNEVYSYYLEDDSSLPGWNESAKFTQCLEQCYGIGTGCVAVLWAHNVTYVAYGVQGTGIACLFMHVPIEQGDLVGVSDGSYTQATAMDIECPS